MSLKRLTGLLRQLWRGPQILRKYDAVISYQLDEGIVEAVEEFVKERSSKTRYVPHYAVVWRDKETTRLTIVYDISAQSNGPSLIDCLYAGPSFGQNILDILLRCRVLTIAVAGDIEKAFLMISVAEKDRYVLWFLWIDVITKMVPEDLTLTFKRVMFGVFSSPFLLNATIRLHIE